MSSQAKAQALFRDLSDKLKVRLAGSASINTVRAANDANGWPMLFCSNNGTETEAAAVIVLRMTGQDAVSKDVFGNALTSYAPHILEIAYENTATANKAIPKQEDIMTVEWEAFKLGSRTQLKEIANGTAVTETSMNAATASVDLDGMYWPTKGV